MTTQTTTSTPAVEISGISKQFGDHLAVQPLDLEIGDNEFFSILGPSGCGKTTLMRMITGFETPSSGRVRLGGVDVTDVPTRNRDLNMLFQSYALFPHLTVFENVAFELRVRKVAKAEANARAQAALELVKLAHLGERKPDQLSGGQRQRVALARAVVSGPKVVLLDEPLGALDQQLRKEMQFELKRMQREVGITFIYVTHDQEEALTMSDRIAVMSEGVVQQVASPEEIYDQPQTRFVAGFIGSCNLIDVTVPGGAAGTQVAATVAGIGTLNGVLAEDVTREQQGTMLIRPERIEMRRGGEGLVGRVESLTFLGEEWQVHVNVSGTTLKVSLSSLVREIELPGLAVGEELTVSWRPEDARIVIR
ncbi:ABC transporter ATP-binding protein [Leucobacter aridicollis]|uniref:Spermidine/putrescine import ATP-binding protein PotA n=1 Tax=Leucobacter aridicollis TaxID=283878 RepID=A0A852R4V5_9MICO|nr:ABC transporter ATP-binding protein [Leucobacter aridicollis]MBL3683262.1 ABC transporter ATP-binding protein [Leucobacter aridicollis]NYD25499.1 spermidine/putrescine transport system ATP-binding protein/putrescine transport system ATP-binding protein [Leucobacter aridicollis]